MARGYTISSPEGFWSALKEVWLAPGRFFRNLDPEGGPIRPTMFAAAVLYVDLVFGRFLQAAVVGEFSFSLLYVPLLGVAVALVFAPVLLSMFTALVLVVLDGGPSRARFGPVYRALGYASGVGIVAWIPYGPILAVLYGAYVATLAVRETFAESWRRATLSTLIPLVALIVIVVVLAGQTSGYEFLLNPAGS